MTAEIIGLADRREAAPEAPEANAICVEALETLLEQARAGEIVGIGATMLHRDNQVSWRVAGVVGGFGMLGALRLIEQDLLEIQRE